MKSTKISMLLALFLPLELMALTDSALYQPGAAMAANRMNHFSTVMSNGNVALFGGHGTQFVSLRTMEIYNPSLNTFTSYNMNYIHDYGAICELADGTWLIAGGADDLGVAPGEKTAEIYNPADNSFTPCGSMTYPRFMANGARLKSGNVLVAGGWYDVTSATYGELFTASTKVFSATGALNQPRSNPVVLPTRDGGAVVLGGCFYYAGTYYESVEYYNPQTNQFTVQAARPIPNDSGWFMLGDMYLRPMASQQLASGEYLLGAWRTVGSVNEYGLMLFNDSTKAFRKITLANPLPKSDSASFINAPIVDKANNRAFWFCVDPTSATYQVKLYVIDLARNTSRQLPPSFTPGFYWSYCGVSLLQNGQLLVSGGTSANDYYTNFSPVTNTVLVTPRVGSAVKKMPGSADPLLLFTGNYPNPCRGRATIRFEAPHAGWFNLSIYNAAGKKVATLLDGMKPAGSHRVTFDTHGYTGGTYFCKLRSGTAVYTRALEVME